MLPPPHVQLAPKRLSNRPVQVREKSYAVQRRKKLPEPSGYVVSDGHDAMHVPLYRYIEFLHAKHVFGLASPHS